MDAEFLRAIYPNGSQDMINGMVRHAHGIEVAGLDGERALALLATIGHETAGLTRFEENLHYSANRLCQVWPKRFPDTDAARPYERKPEALANLVYGGRMGNGVPATGDGWRFRGRGLIQLTGRDNYARVGREISLDLVLFPDLACHPDHALAVALGYWMAHDLNGVFDRRGFEGVCRVINGGTVGLADRIKWWDLVVDRSTDHMIATDSAKIFSAP